MTEENMSEENMSERNMSEKNMSEKNMSEENMSEENMSEKKHLYVLWTSGDPVTAEKMVLMYTTNALKFAWWEEITLVIWGAASQLVAQDTAVQARLQEAREAGVYVTACKACADQLGVTQALEALGIEVQYLGVALTNVLKNEEALLTI